MANFNKNQVMLALCYISYYGYALTGDDSKNAQRIAKLIDSALQEWKPVAGNWQRVWGPAVFALPATKFDDSLVYVVQNVHNSHEYAVVVRGTNPVSIPDWIIWDFQAKDLKLWPFFEGDTAGKTHAELPCVSESSYFGINIMQTLRPPLNNHPSERTERGEARFAERHADVRAVNQSLLEFFNEAQSRSQQPLDITTTGHSLGGALSPLIALWLKQEQTKATVQSEFSTVTFAGPTSGNGAFVKYFNEQLPNAVTRVANDLDIVTLAWNEEQMKKMFSVYLWEIPPLLPLPPTWLGLEILKSRAKGKDYQHLTGDQTTFPGDFAHLAIPYITQALYQHVISYPKLLDMEDDIPLDSWLPFHLF